LLKAVENSFVVANLFTLHLAKVSVAWFPSTKVVVCHFLLLCWCYFPRYTISCLVFSYMVYLLSWNVDML